MRTSTLFAILGLLALVNICPAIAAQSIGNLTTPYYTQPNITTFSSFLALYVPNSIAASSLYINQSVGSHSYIIIELNKTPMNFAIVNKTSGKFSFVISQSTAAAVLTPYLVSKYEPSTSAINNITNTVKSYKSQAYGPINDCLLETGVNSYLCTASTPITTCLQSACGRVPICQKALNGLGVPSPFSNGVYNFSLYYASLNTSFVEFFNYAIGINQSNMAGNLQQMSNLLSSIQSTSVVLYQNPLWLNTTPLSGAQVNTCVTAVGFTGPWYCYIYGFCEVPDQNYTALTAAQTQIAALLALPFTNASIQNTAFLAVNNAESFYQPIAVTGETVAFNKFINATMPGYNETEANLSFVAAKFKNASLQAAFSQLAIIYSNIEMAGINQNLTLANMSLQSAEANAVKAYRGPVARYLAVYNLALNNTALLLLNELNYKTPPGQISSLATAEVQLNQKLNGQVNFSQLSSINTQAATINAQLKTISPPFSLGGAIKSFGSKMISAMLASPSIALATKNSLAPLYAGAIALLIGIIILAIIYLATYNRLKAKRKLKLTPSVHRAWSILFLILFIIALLFAFTIYSFAQGANTFLPASSFVSSIPTSTAVYILTNSSIASNSSVAQCIAAVRATLTTITKNLAVYSTTFNSNGCTDPANPSVNGASCISTIVSTGQPVIMINPGNSSITYRGFYGDVLYVNGASASSSSCPLGQLVRAG